MEEYIVSARKYRPMTFDSVVGQEALTTTLKNAVKSGKLAHAYLFCGPRGVGKTTCARIFAKAINCETPTEEGEACNHCESCKAFNEQRSYNIFELDAASNNSVENIKVLMEQTRIPPQIGKYKVFIIDEVHMLSTAAFNAFLKTLEEPPAHVIFILATTEKHKILPTIISRCQIYDFERMTVPNIVNHLKMVAEKEGITYEEEALNIIAEKADGGMRDALSVFDQVASFCQGNITYQKVIDDLNVLDTENYFNIINLALENKVADIMVLLNNVINNGFDGGHLISGLASHVRNVLNCDVNYRQSSNKRLLVELTLIQVAQITQEDDTPSAGRSPKRLKSLFKKLVKNVQVKVAPQGGAERSQKKSDEPTAPVVQPADTTPAAPATPKPQPRVRIDSIGMTFANLSKSGEKPAFQKENEEEAQTGEQRVFDEDMLLMQWTAMCNRMPQQMTAMATRMKNMTPVITEFPHIEVVIDNEILLDQMKTIQKRIRNTLVTNLHNNDITLHLRLAKPDEVKKILNNREMLEDMRVKHPALEHLLGKLELELV